MKLRGVLSIAGSDSCCGAGIQGDLKVFSALKVHGCTVVTAITAQNTQSVVSIQEVDAGLIEDQIRCILEDFEIQGIKIGMLYSAKIASRVSEIVKTFSGPIVIDPVLHSSYGQILYGKTLWDKQALECLKSRLLGLACLVTPNQKELLLLSQTLSQTKLKTFSIKEIEESCKKLFQEIKTPILMTGGDDNSDIVCDILYNGEQFEYFKYPKIMTDNIHGTGCALSSAITVYLSQGYSLIKSIELSQQFIRNAILGAYEIQHHQKPEKRRRFLNFL